MNGLFHQKGAVYGALTLIALVLGILVSWQELRKPSPPPHLPPPVTELPPSDDIAGTISGLLSSGDCTLQTASRPERSEVDPSATAHGFPAARVQLRFTLAHPGGATPLSVKGSGRGPHAMADAEADLVEAARDAIRAAAPSCI